MIVFDDQEVIGLLGLDQMVGGGSLGIEGVGADQSATQVQVLEEDFKAGDFVGFGRDLDLATDGLRLGVQGTEKLERVAVDFGRGARALTIDGQGGEVQVPEVGTDPAGDQGIELHGVQALEHTADGGFAGGEVAAGFEAAGGAQAAELVLIEGLGEGAQVDERVVAGNEAGGGDGDNGGDAAVAPAFVAARIFERAQRLEKTLGLVQTQRVVVGLGSASIAGPGRGHDGSREDVARLGMEPIDQDGLGMGVELIEVEMGTTETAGDADGLPIGGSVASAFESLRIDIGFGQDQGMVVTRQPIIAQTLEVETQDA